MIGIIERYRKFFTLYEVISVEIIVLLCCASSRTLESFEGIVLNGSFDSRRSGLKVHLIKAWIKY